MRSSALGSSMTAVSLTAIPPFAVREGRPPCVAIGGQPQGVAKPVQAPRRTKGPRSGRSSILELDGFESRVTVVAIGRAVKQRRGGPETLTRRFGRIGHPYPTHLARSKGFSPAS